jgi:hypothetical protein
MAKCYAFGLMAQVQYGQVRPSCYVNTWRPNHKGRLPRQNSSHICSKTRKHLVPPYCPTIATCLPTVCSPSQAALKAGAGTAKEDPVPVGTSAEPPSTRYAAGIELPTCSRRELSLFNNNDKRNCLSLDVAARIYILTPLRLAPVLSRRQLDTLLVLSRPPAVKRGPFDEERIVCRMMWLPESTF